MTSHDAYAEGGLRFWLKLADQALGSVGLLYLQGRDLDQMTSYCHRTCPGCVRTCSGCSGRFGGSRNSAISGAVLGTFWVFSSLCKLVEGLLRLFDGWGVLVDGLGVFLTTAGH